MRYIQTFHDYIVVFIYTLHVFVVCPLRRGLSIWACLGLNFRRRVFCEFKLKPTFTIDNRLAGRQTASHRTLSSQPPLTNGYAEQLVNIDPKRELPLK